MTVRELIKLLLSKDMDYVVYVASLDDTEDYFVDDITVSDKHNTVTIRTAG